jgi:hypothetical protein
VLLIGCICKSDRLREVATFLIDRECSAVVRIPWLHTVLSIIISRRERCKNYALEKGRYICNALLEYDNENQF